MLYAPYHPGVKQGLVNEDKMGLPNCTGDSFTSDTHVKKVTTIPHI